MNREEAIELINDVMTDAVYQILSEEKEALQMAIKALSQEPCEDAVSRDAVRKILTKYRLGESKIAEDVSELPSVTQKSGKCELKALIDKHRMYRLADDELSEFERDVLELAESEE